MTLPTRPGMTVPLPGPLHSHREKLGDLADMGYTDIWSAESDGADAFTPLALAAAWEPRLRLGTAIVPAYTRAPACMAQSVASMADAAPGRFAIGIGSSSNVIVERWNGVPFEEPYKKVRDVVRFLKDALAGEKIKHSYDTFEINGFKLGVRPEQTPPILVAALREGMLRLAGREADGAIINWLSATDVSTVVPVVRDAAGGDDREIVARIFCCPSENADIVRGAATVILAMGDGKRAARAIENFVGHYDAATHGQAVHEAAVVLRIVEPRLVDAPVEVLFAQLLVREPVAVMFRRGPRLRINNVRAFHRLLAVRGLPNRTARLLGREDRFLHDRGGQLEAFRTQHGDVHAAHRG